MMNVIPSSEMKVSRTDLADLTWDAGGGQDVLYQVFVHPGVAFEPLPTDTDHLWLLQHTHLQLKLHGHLPEVRLCVALQSIASKKSDIAYIRNNFLF